MKADLVQKYVETHKGMKREEIQKQIETEVEQRISKTKKG